MPLSRRLGLIVFVVILFGDISSAMSAEPLRPSDTPPPTPALLLVASRQLQHPSFRETVVLVTRHGRGGPIGVIVNRPLDIRLKDVFPSLPDDVKQTLHEGGPVERRQISYIFRSSDRVSGTLVVAEQTYIARSPALLAELLRGSRPHTGLRVIAGYAGWAPGQLENEIARGDWLVMAVDSQAIFDKPVASMWAELHRRASETRTRSVLPDADIAAFRAGTAMLISAAPFTHSGSAQ